MIYLTKDLLSFVATQLFIDFLMTLLFTKTGTESSHQQAFGNNTRVGRGGGVLRIISRHLNYVFLIFFFYCAGFNNVRSRRSQ